MGIKGELAIKRELFKALEDVLGEPPTTLKPVIVLAAYLYSLVNGYGLTDSQHLDPNKIQPAPLADDARKFIDHFIPGSADGDSLRDSLYGVFASMSADADIRRRINKSSPLSDTEVLLLGQIAWNLERNARRRRLPLEPRSIQRDGKPFILDIPVHKQDLDIATMKWTERRNLSGVPGKSTGAGFGNQAARLAVLAAKWLLDVSAESTPDICEACLTDGPQPGTKRIVWNGDSAQEPRGASDFEAQGLSVMPRTARRGPVVVGDFAEVGDRYQLRGFDSEISSLWADGGDRRVWLRGGPGLGKSYAARRVMQEALSDLDGDRPDLLIWVNSADSVTVTREFSRAAELLGDVDSSVPADAMDRDDLLTRALLEHLRITDRRWLIVLDDADAEGLIEEKLVPTGRNPRGRVLVTTLSSSHRIGGAGRDVEAELFSRAEAEEFLKNRLPETAQDDRGRLSKTVGHHPLALSIAASTIAANRMTVSAWIDEFNVARRMDEAADFSDVGGYPRLIGTTWKLALDRASQDMPQGVVERAAIIAALQDPDGHPTWLWQCDDVREWVAGGADFPSNKRRIHPAIRRLVDYGIIGLVGGWLDGRLTIHQLASRAVREASAPETQAEIGALLADQWLLELTVNPANTRRKDVRSGMGPIAALSNLAQSARNTVNALLSFSQPSTSEGVLGWNHYELGLLSPHLKRGGVLGRAELAERLADVGLGERALGRHEDADRNLAEAADIYRGLIDIPDLSSELLVKYLESLADLDDELNRPEQARENRMNAAGLRERFEASRPAGLKPIANQLALAETYEKLANQEGAEAALQRALVLGQGESPATGEAGASTHAGLARRLASAGRFQEAEEHMRRAAELYETTNIGRIVHLEKITAELGSICAQAGKWREAEDCFTRSGREPVLLASVLLHQGRTDEVRANLARVASNHAGTSDQSDLAIVQAQIHEDIESSVLPLLQSLAGKAMRWERWKDAADLAEACLELARDREDSNPGDDPTGLAQTYFIAGLTSLTAERIDNAVAFFTSSVDILEMLNQMSPTAELQLKYGQSLYFLARTTQKTGSPDSAAPQARRAVEILSPLDSEDARRCLSDALEVLAQVCRQIGAADDGIACFSRRVDLWKKEVEKTPDDGDAKKSLAKAYIQLGQALAALPQFHDPVPPLTTARDLYLDLHRSQPEDSEAQTEVANVLFHLAWAYDRSDRPAESASLAQESVTAWQALLDAEPTNLGVQVSMAYALCMLSGSVSKLDRDVEAISVLNRAAEHLQLPTELRPEDHGPLLMEVLTELEGGFRSLGQTAQADEVRERAKDLARRYPMLGGDE